MSKAKSSRTKPAPVHPLAVVADKLRPPIAILLGSPRGVLDLLPLLNSTDVLCYQLDLFQADRLQEELTTVGSPARIATIPDLWDLPSSVQTIVYPAPLGAERDLKIDLVEQAFHVLAPHGTLVVLSPYCPDQLFPSLLKKIFRRVHTPAVEDGTLFWCQREGDRPRRRHEVTFHARVGDGPPLTFLSRPGVFAYGRFDDGARALVETMTVEPGDRVLDMGCGCGTNGVAAGRLSGPKGSVTFVDSNVRAVVLAEHNARANGLVRFQTVASSRLDGLPKGGFDVILANPPYYAQLTIAEFFVDRSRSLLRPGGRLYLVTKQVDLVAPQVVEFFEDVEVFERRGYDVICARAPAARTRQR